jgi:hypothetical protein
MKPYISIATLVALSTFAAMQAAEVYKEPHVRYLIADMTLGGSPDYYRQHARDPVPATALKEWEAVAYLEAGYKVTNLDQFELRPVKNSPIVVYKGTETRVDPFDIRLTSDLPKP